MTGVPFFTGGELPAGGAWLHIPPAMDFSMTPRQRWKAQHSATRWERRYGKPKAMFTGHVGTFDGVRIIRSGP